MSTPKSFGGVANIYNRDFINADSVDYDDTLNLYPPTVITVEDALDYLASAPPPTVASMTPTVEGIAYGSTDQLGRTMLGYRVDDSSSNNVNLWSSSTGGAQGLCNSTSAITAFVDTDTNGATLLNSVVLLEAGSVAGANLSNSSVIGRGSDFSNGSDYTQSNLLVNGYVSQVGDELSGSQAMISGSFEQPSQFRKSVVLGEATNLRTLGVADNAIVIRPGNAGGLPVRVAAGGCLIGQGTAGTVVATGEFRLSAYNNYYVDGIPSGAAANMLVYNTATNRITYTPVSAAPVDMTPTVSGLAYGTQDTAKQLNSLGRGVSTAVATNRSTVRYQPAIVGTPQAAIYGSCILDDNRCSQNASTSLANSIASLNETGISGMAATASTIIANTSTLAPVPVANSICVINTTDLGSSPQFLDSAVVVNSSGFGSSTFNKSVALTSRFSAAGFDLSGATIVGDGSNVVAGNLLQSAFIASSSGSVVNMNGAQSLYLGNQSRAETVVGREAWISSYDKFFLRTLRLAAGTNVAVYDPVSSELTYSSLATVLPLKQPTVLGGQYGISSSANNVEVNGINSFTNYAAVPAQISGVAAVGNALYQASVPASNSFTNDIFLGRTHQFTGAASISNSLIAASIIGNAGITSITDCNIVTPRAASTTFGYAGAITGAMFVSSGSTSCLSDPQFSTVLSSGGTVNPGVSNLVLAENLGAGSIVMSGSGNTLISSSSAAQTYNWPAGINNTTLIRSGGTAITPTQGNQVAFNHSSLYFPNLPSVTPGNATYPAALNLATGTVNYVNSADFSRTLRRVGTTNASGQIVFNLGVISTAADSVINLTVRNTSTTTAYTAQVIAIATSTVTVQVFNSVTVVLASPSMAPSGAGITVHMSMAY